MTVEYFYTGGGPFAWRGLLALVVKRIDFVPRFMDLATGETRTPGFLALNPRGTLPVLRDGAVVVRESQAILFYLDRAYPEPPLYGRTPAEAARIMQEMCEQGSGVEASLRRVIGPLLFGSGPVSGLGESASPLQADLADLDAHLSGSPWLAGDALSAADLNLYPFVPTYERALRQPAAEPVRAALPQLGEAFPHIERWRRAIEGIEGYARSVPGARG
jgi:glutathione S-transferase